MKYWIWVGLIGISILSIKQVSSLECYVCDSTNPAESKDCGHGEDVHPKHKTVCNRENRTLGYVPEGRDYTLCRKIVTTIDFDVNRNKAGQRIKRVCGWEDSEEKYNNACYKRAGLGGRVTVCSCQTDNCNDATLNRLSSILITIVPITIAKLAHIF